jgi:sugar porter (SP) family MFS transporter
MPSQDAPSAAQRRSRVRAITLVAALGGFLFGYDTGVISGALLFIEDDFELTSFTEGCVVSGLLIGAAIGALLAGQAADRFGRRPTLIATAAVFAVGIAIAALSPSLPLLIAGRFVIGLGVGMGSMVVPVYLGEVAPPDLRGRVVSANQLMITSGIVVAYLVDYALADAEAWRIMLAVALVPSVLLGVGMLRMPESPRWLLAQDRDEEARAVLRSTLSSQETEETLRGLADAPPAAARDFRRLLEPRLRPALTIGIGLAVLQQLVGINTVIYYAPTILEDTGVGSSNAILNAVVIGVVNVVMTVISLRLVDRAGRRPLLVVSVVGMLIALVVAGLGTGSSTVLLLALVAYVAAFAVGMGPIFWLMLAEVFPQDVRAEGAAVATAANWLANFTVALTFPVVVDAIGQGETFLVYAAICVLTLWFVLRKVPETKDRTLEEIQDDLGRRVPRAAAAAAAARTA